ncbi:MAG TPA: Uma2 family endonuclease [Chthonomonadaceae bacterium]|nr:Uma2 family endonuclease [Chthonomonadaceae bacterium]
MKSLIRETTPSVEGYVAHIAERPIQLEDFIDMAQGRYVELVDGVIEGKDVIQVGHEFCSAWLYQVLGPFVKHQKLGVMFASRILVEVDEFGGRLPDLLFVKEQRLNIIKEQAVYGAPDLVIEIDSPGTRRAARLKLEAEYRRLGVPEIVFINLDKGTMRFIRKRGGSYAEEVVSAGPVRFEAIEGLTLDADWILREPRPDVIDTLIRLTKS